MRLLVQWTFVCLAFLAVSSVLDGAEEDAPQEKSEPYWAFQPVEKPVVPAVQSSERVKTAVDSFLLSQLEEQGLTLSPPASKRNLIRRAKFDLHGLPPTPEEIDEFLADDGPNAYERMIDRLLASPRYGEHWGRYWLDLIRYAETAGFNADPFRPLAYKYRDYVIRAFNENRPYDRFVQEQIAGDELFPENTDALVATGFNRMWPDESNASNILLARQDALNDLTANVGAVFLGVSIGCAQCHDHKFDPLTQEDFYRLQSFFSGIVLQDRVAVGTNAELDAHKQAINAWLSETAAVRDELHEIEQQAEAKASRIKRLKFPKVVLDAIDTHPLQRTAFQHQLTFWSERQIEVDEKKLLAQLSDAQKRRREELKARLVELEKKRPKPSRMASVMATVEVQNLPPKTYLLAGGSYDAGFEEVQPGFLSAVEPAETRLAKVVAPREGTSGRRAALADWLTNPNNPLSARVMVNRIWQGHFGRGIVANGNDFGTQTLPPTHPQLLDWLAAEFVQSGWDIKVMHRLIMTSAIYRQQGQRASADAGKNHADANHLRARQLDSENMLYWHYPRRRLTAESVRDAMLVVAGKVNLAMYGPGVRPELPPNFSARHAWKVSEQVADRNRRSVYIHAARNLPYPLLNVFDLPDMHESCAMRAETTVAPQALMVLNSELIVGFAESFAGRILSSDPTADPAKHVEEAYTQAFGRPPQSGETELAVAFIEGQAALVRERQGRGEETTVPPDFPKFADLPRSVAFIDFCHALMNSNEFLYVD